MDAKLFIDLLPDLEDFLIDIHTAASIGCDERVRDIIENSESRGIIDECNKIGWTPLMYAACCANLKVVLLLLEEGAETDLKNNEGHTALTLASKCGSSDVVNLLLDNGAKVNDKDLRGWTALFHSIAFGHRSVTQLLIERGASVDIMDDNERITPLMLAAAAGHERIVQDLLQMGVNVNAECKSGYTAKSLAIKNGHINIKNMIDTFLRSKKKSSAQNLRSADLASLLKELHLTKYYHIFENHGIDLSTFWLLNDNDLTEIGIQLLGPRKKMCMAISQYHQEHSQKSNSKENGDNLRMENKKLHHLAEKLQATVLHEQNSRRAAEQSLADRIQSIQNYSNKVNAVVGQVASLLEKQKENNEFLRSMLCSVIQEMSFTNNGVKPKINSIFQCLDFMQKLVEMQHQSIISIQQTSFRK